VEHHRSLFTPERVTHCRERVDESRLWFGVPCDRGASDAFADRQKAGVECDIMGDETEMTLALQEAYKAA
jgi:hypothetical protein